MTVQTTASQSVYLLDEAYGLGKDVLGGKGHGLVEMNHAGLPVPPSMIISTRICSEYYERGQRFPQDLMPTVLAKLKKLEERTGKKFGKSLLVSVRSGAPLSMPGMMDTILNLGLNDEVLQYLITSTNNERFAYDTYRRFVQMYGKIVEGIEASEFENLIQKKKDLKGVKNDVGSDCFRPLRSSETIQTTIPGKDWEGVSEQSRRTIEESYRGSLAILDGQQGNRIQTVLQDRRQDGDCCQHSGNGVW